MRAEEVVNEYAFDSLCVDPGPGPATQALAKGKVPFWTAEKIDTKANMKWRDATVAFLRSKISPKEWLARTANLHETVHFLTTPATTDLFTLTKDQKNGLGTYSGPAVLGEFLVLSWPGRVCFTSRDTWLTGMIPQEPGPQQSWVLAMNDFVGPLLSFRSDNFWLVYGKPSIIRADAVPGLLVYHLGPKGKGATFYFNNGLKPIDVSKVKVDKSLFIRGLDLDDGPAKLLGCGSLMEYDEARK